MKSSLTMALARTTLATLTVAVLCVPVARAQQTFQLLSTGINASGTTIAAGSQDPFWTWQQVSTLPADTYVPTNEFVDWQADVANQYHWVSTTGNANGNAGATLWGTTFDLTGYDPTTATITFQCAVDNNFGTIFLNGIATSAVCGAQSTTDYKFGGNNTLSSGFIAGVNTLTFNSSGDGVTDGIVVDIENSQAVLAPAGPPGTSVTPEPASMLLLATGLVGLVPAMRRRRRA